MEENKRERVREQEFYEVTEQSWKKWGWGEAGRREDASGEMNGTESGGGRETLPSALASKVEVEGGQSMGPKPCVSINHEGGACQGRHV